ncbi:hypothetical protein ROZALSC1DRAFT_27030 [Rozella allomycis CSF55]|uniref:Uncharacterized protein n=1 Tax=Rozella allomycis (strain CSF55) TaxID=988480 RepID=A0A4P9YPK1_ROZAC|nr:hypothetical protein ROZALSC1DRAFT_27030 [Rozella allomycis CSF55]
MEMEHDESDLFSEEAQADLLYFVEQFHKQALTRMKVFVDKNRGNKWTDIKSDLKRDFPRIFNEFQIYMKIYSAIRKKFGSAALSCLEFFPFSPCSEWDEKTVKDIKNLMISKLSVSKERVDDFFIALLGEKIHKRNKKKTFRILRFSDKEIMLVSHNICDTVCSLRKWITLSFPDVMVDKIFGVGGSGEFKELNDENISNFQKYFVGLEGFEEQSVSPADQTNSVNLFIDDEEINYTPRFHGEGGTTFPLKTMSSLRHEGVGLQEPWITKRRETCEEIYNKMKHTFALLIRSPPGSGKSSLAVLLEDYYLQKKVRVIRISMLWSMRRKYIKPYNFEELFFNAIGITFQEWIEECETVESVLILDEVNTIYGEDNANFWGTLKSSKQDRLKLKVVLFSAYGYKDGRSNTATPIDFVKGDTLSLSTLLLKKIETDEYVNNFINYNGIKVRQLELICNEIQIRTNGHVLLITFLLESLNEEFRNNISANPGYHLNLDVFIGLLIKKKAISAISNSRACLNYHKINDNLVPTIKLMCYGAKIEYENSVVHSMILNQGLAMISGDYLEFVCPIMQRLVFRSVFGDSSESLYKPSNIQELIVCCVKSFNKHNLITNRGFDTKNRLMESCWQNELYCALIRIYGPNATISPDVGTQFKTDSSTNGYIDFVVEYNRSTWGIELCREGLTSTLSEHLNRFDPDTGKYRNMVNILLDDYVVVHFCSQDAYSIIPSQWYNPRIMFIRYSPDFSSFTVYCNGSELVVNLDNV